MDTVTLARFQFAFTIGFHYLFPPLTLGLTLFILVLETLHLRTRQAVLAERFKTLSSFFVKILALIFVVGVATGITMEFAFGTNWARYSRIVGDIFGAPLAAEAVFSFFLESVFMGILVFGRTRVSKQAYWLSAFLVFLGSHLSGLWILIANSWMQTPAGFEIQDEFARLTDFWAAALNPSILQRFMHTIVAGWITGLFFAAGICAWYLLRQKHLEYARLGLSIAGPLILLATVAQFGTGHMHAVQVAKTQPEKMAAFEALWETQPGAPLALFGIPDSTHPTGIKTFGIPKLLSLLIDFDPNSTVRGLRDFMPREDFEAFIKAKPEQSVFHPDAPAVRPPVAVPFYAYHLMIMSGSWFTFVAFVGVMLFWRGKLFERRWFLWSIIVSVPLAELANQVGWIAAEVGRQPWAVYHLLPTSRAASTTVTAGHLWFSLIGFGSIYALLFAVFLLVLSKLIKKGPELLAEKQGY